jgi:hypothetical protein
MLIAILVLGIVTVAKLGKSSNDDDDDDDSSRSSRSHSEREETVQLLQPTRSYRPYDSSYGDQLYLRYTTEWTASTPSQEQLNAARLISNGLMSYPTIAEFATPEAACAQLPNANGVSMLLVFFGQLLDHDISETASGSQWGSFEIDMSCDPVADPHCAGFTFSMTRSEYELDENGVRQQRNQLTAYLDASVVYGSDPVRAAELRSYEKGKLKTSAGDFLPYNLAHLPNAGGDKVDSLFLAGDVRANENPLLCILHTLFVREHNYWAVLLHKKYPDWSDENLYWTARKLVTAELQVITYQEFLPALLGTDNEVSLLLTQPTLHSRESATLQNSFAAAAYRLHSLLADTLYVVDTIKNAAAGTEEGDGSCLKLSDGFFKPQLIKELGLEELLLGAIRQPAEEMDTLIVDSLRNGLHFAGFFDLATINILRGMDHGLPPYSLLRAAVLGEDGVVSSWSSITSNVEVQQKLEKVYGEHAWDKVHAWVGMLAEDHLPGSLLGPTAAHIVADQFRRMRDSDPYFYLWDQSGTLAEFQTQVEATRLFDIIIRNTQLTAASLPSNKNVFQKLN